MLKVNYFPLTATEHSPLQAESRGPPTQQEPDYGAGVSSALRPATHRPGNWCQMTADTDRPAGLSPGLVLMSLHDRTCV